MMDTQSGPPPDGRIRLLLARKALRGGRINGKRRIHQRALAEATGIPPDELSRLLSGALPLTVQRWGQLMRAINTLTKGGRP